MGIFDTIKLCASYFFSLDWNYLMIYNRVQKTLKKPLHKKCKYKFTLNAVT